MTGKITGIEHKLFQRTIPKPPPPNAGAPPRGLREEFCLKFEPLTPAGPREEAGAGAGEGAGAGAGARADGVAFPFVIHAGSVADRPRPRPAMMMTISLLRPVTKKRIATPG